MADGNWINPPAKALTATGVDATPNADAASGPAAPEAEKAEASR